MLLYPSTEQYKLPYPIFEATVNSLPTYQENIPTITIELQKPTIDQLICYPTVEQYYLADNMLKPTICHQTCRSFISKPMCKSSTEPIPTILIKFGKPN
ncbi:hypothetical protein CDAR_212221 [Caerostris darwini]|uniref:Uncharacterized protein n=1 Tax=Caerostris darwini TaxID=1538125 RepID=A0AAV4NSC5_9ARAC|nr:hypothetical protein CDAR_212221 [Caerostris darwini]